MLFRSPFSTRCARIPLLAGVLRMPSRVPCLSIPPPECDTTRYPAFLSVFSSFLLSTKPGRAHALAILACSLLTSASAFFQSMDFHWCSSCTVSGNLSGLLRPVVEQFPFIGLPPFLAMKYHGISQRPFRLGQSLNPYPPHYRAAFAFYPVPLPSAPFLPLAGSIPPAEERIGLTTFHITNNSVCFRSHL